MVRIGLNVFIQSMLQKGHMGSDDLAIFRNILPDGLANRDEVEAVLSLDRQLACTDPAWVEYLANAVTEFVVWGTRPTGRVDANTAGWLVASLSCEPVNSNTTHIACEFVSQAHFVDHAPIDFAVRKPKRRQRWALAWKQWLNDLTPAEPPPAPLARRMDDVALFATAPAHP